VGHQQQQQDDLGSVDRAAHDVGAHRPRRGGDACPQRRARGCRPAVDQLYSQSPSWDTASADKSRPNAGYLSAPRMVPAGDIALCARSCVLAPLVPRWRRCASWYASVRWYAGLRKDRGRSGFRGRSGQRGGTFLSTKAGSSAITFLLVVLVIELWVGWVGAGW
jgi:hypothetical protein